MSTIKLSTPSEKSVTLPIDLEDGGDIIEVTVPLFKWMPRKHVREYNAWMTEMRDLAEKYDAWEKKAPSKRGPAPCDPEDIPTAGFLFQLRWLKPFLSAEDFTRVWEEATPGLADQIKAAMDGDGEVTEGESEASAS